MDLRLSDDQQLLKDTLERFARNEYNFDTRRKLTDSEDGFSRDIWQSHANLGLLGIPFAEEDGGIGGGPIEVMIVMEQLGRALALEPYLPTVVLAGRAIVEAGSAAQKEQLLGEIIAGEALWAFAHAEPGARYDLAHVETRAEGGRLSGHKAVVHGAVTADKLVVSARSEAGISLYVVAGEADGLTLRPYRTIDGLRAAEVMLDNVAGELLGEDGSALPVIESVIDRATAAVCAEAVGAMDVLRETTLEYLQMRKQFGVPIGTFQVLQHRSVEMMGNCEEARSLTLMATLSLDQDVQARARAVSAAKVGIGTRGRHVGQEAIQMHGGMGMTDELKVGHYFKRVSMIDAMFGNTDHHLDRFGAASMS